MHNDAKLDVAKTNLANGPQNGSLWRHVKSGNLYRVIVGAVQEATLEPAVVYCNAEALIATVWVRPLAEFTDGRFTREG